MASRGPGLAALGLGFFMLLPTGDVDAAVDPSAMPPATRPGGALPRGEFRFERRDEAAPFRIPPVYDRPLGVEQGPRIFVNDFEIVGIRTDVEDAVSREEVERRVRQRFEEIRALLEKLRQEAQNLTEVDEDGFTPAERERIIEFMEDVVGDLGPDRKIEEYRRLVNSLRLDKLERERGLTIGQLQQIADEVTQYYREQGFFLARAVIPEQEVEDGVVTIRVLEGRLGTVRPKGNERYGDGTLRAPFRDLSGRLITLEGVENALLTVSNLPGVSAFGVFRPGDDVGTSDIVLNVQNESAWEATVRADNHGTEFTGEQRLVGTFDWNNPLGGGDRLETRLIKTFNPENALFGSLGYERPVAGPYYRAGLEISRNAFDVGQVFALGGGGGADIGGTSEVARLYLDTAFERTRTRRITGIVDFSRKRAETEFFGAVTGRDDLAVLGLELNLDLVDAEEATVTSGSVRIDHGFAGRFGVPSEDEAAEVSPPPTRFGRTDDGEVVPATGAFDKLSIGFSRVRSVGAGQDVLFRLRGQYSPDILTSLEQFVIGGPDNVRALPTSTFLADTGGFASLEWRIPAPGFSEVSAFGDRSWGELLTVSLFTDHAVGLLNDPINARDKRFTAGGSGLGIEFSQDRNLYIRLDAARLNGGARQGTNPNDPGNIEDDTQYWLQVAYTF